MDGSLVWLTARTNRSFGVYQLTCVEEVLGTNVQNEPVATGGDRVSGSLSSQLNEQLFGNKPFSSKWWSGGGHGEKQRISRGLAIDVYYQLFPQVFYL